MKLITIMKHSHIAIPINAPGTIIMIYFGYIQQFSFKYILLLLLLYYL